MFKWRTQNPSKSLNCKILYIWQIKNEMKNEMKILSDLSLWVKQTVNPVHLL